MNRWPTPETDPVAEADLAAHEAATTNVHGTGVNVTSANIGTYASGAADASTTAKGVSKLSVAPASGTNPIAVGDNDPRNTDNRTPSDGSVTAAKVNTALKPSGSAATSDEALRALGSGSTQAAAGDDSRFPTAGQKNALAGSSGTPGTTNKYVTDQDARLTDTRTPTDASVTDAKIATTLSPAKITGTAVVTADSRLSDARTPTAHASSHAAAGSDPLTLSESQVTNLTTDLAAKAPLASPTLTGDPKAPTPAVDDNDTSIATTAYVIGQASASGDGTPAMDGTAARGTATHWARADHTHPTDTSLAPKASPALTGTPTAPTAAADTNTTQLATTAYVVGQAYAKLASPTLTGTPAAPTAAQGTNTTQLATTGYVQTEVGLLVPKSLVDAKGDLFAGTADNTVARKAVGSNGQALVADSGTTDGLAWALQSLHIHRSGRWYTAPVTTVVNNLTPVQGRVYAMPFMVARRTTYDRIGINVKTVGPTNDVVRLGIYADDGNGAPGAKILDAGTVDTASSAVAVAATISQALAPGLYWLTFVEQGANGVIVGGFTASVIQYMPPLGRSTGSDGNAILSWRSASDLASGVLLDPFPASPTDTTVCPMIWMRAA